MGDLGLFRTVLDAAQLPARWQTRLSNAFWRQDAFRTELKRLSTAPAERAKRLPAELLAALSNEDTEKSEASLAAYLEARNIEVVGTRSVAEMTEHLRDIAADAREKPLDAATARLIESYVAIAGPAPEAADKIAMLLKGSKGGTGAALDAYDRRLAALSNAGIDLGRVTFSAEFGRNLEYYTGLVFEVVTPNLGPASPVAGGGRYDKLMRAAGAKVDVPAVGAAIHTERLLQAVSGGRS